MVATRVFSPLDPVVQQDPYPFYEELRRGPAATYLPEDDLWVVPRFRHVWDVARNPDFYSSKGLRAFAAGAASARSGPRPDLRALDSKLARSLIASDPPDHVRLRRLVARPFTPRSIATLERRVRQICESLVDELVAAGEHGDTDLVTQVAIPFPVLVIAEVLGIPPERLEDFKRWSDALVGQLDGEADLAAVEHVATIKEMTAFFYEIVAERTVAPRDDLISWIVATSAENGEELQPRDFVSFCTLLLVAGNETTTNLIGNLYQALFDRPDQHERVNQLADLSPVVEEALRYDTSIQGILRLTNGDLDLDGVEIPQDAVVLILFGSANRDESRWPDAGRFDVDRAAQDHLGFGSGIHLCLGAHLARLETRVVVDTLRRRLRRIEPSGPAARTRSIILRGFTSMPVAVEPR
jgi:cytochrome P450